ncbi:short-chain dehydrogenase [Oleispira antarctica]|uniref:Short-chain dehydrogenase n=1 Tax=Oleispira antarctica TaxID=188908 RepID=A0A1Y5HS83_OLEAN|nr:short-chain dehydrogenase [Oleispira antarctica]
MICNKTILIAGASSGIGRQVALLLSLHNNRIIVSARRQYELDSLCKEIITNGSKALAIQCDALSAEQAENCVKRSLDEFNHIDIALLNIGAGPAINMTTATVDEINHNCQLNYGTQVNFLVPLIAQMKQQDHGLIAHTNSLAGFLGLPMQGPYSAAKAAGRMLMDSCRIELKPFGIKFVSIYPGFIATERVKADGIPSPFQISELAAAKHVIRALEKETADYLFPFITASLVRLARMLPKPLTNKLLAKLIPAEY